jgi:hypothetical protein
MKDDHSRGLWITLDRNLKNSRIYLIGKEKEFNLEIRSRRRENEDLHRFFSI